MLRFESGIVWALNQDNILSGDVARSTQFFTVNAVFKMATSFPGALKAEQDAIFAPFTTHALLPIFPEEFWVRE